MISKEYYDKYMRKLDEGICPTCGKETPWQSFNNGYQKHCSYKCTRNDPNVVKKREEHFIQKYGVKNPYRAEEVNQKIKETIDFSGPQLLECNIYGSGTFNLK